MKDKIVVITGASGGIGKETARGLARQGATVVMVSQDPGRGEAALQELRNATGNTSLHFIAADLSSLAEVRRVAGDIRDRFPRVDVLINNAAAIPKERTVTADGLELAFATNVAAPF